MVNNYSMHVSIMTTPPPLPPPCGSSHHLYISEGCAECLHIELLAPVHSLSRDALVGYDRRYQRGRGNIERGVPRVDGVRSNLRACHSLQLRRRTLLDDNARPRGGLEGVS